MWIAFWVLLAFLALFGIWRYWPTPHEHSQMFSAFGDQIINLAGKVILFACLVIIGWHLFGPSGLKECGCKKRIVAGGHEQIEHLGPK